MSVCASHIQHRSFTTKRIKPQRNPEKKYRSQTAECDLHAWYGQAKYEALTVSEVTISQSLGNKNNRFCFGVFNLFSFVFYSPYQ